MPLRKKILSILCGSVLVATVLAVSHDSVGTPAGAAQQSDDEDVPQAQVDGVAGALGISADDARDRLLDQDDAHQVYKRLPKELADRLAGHWFDAESGTLAVAVTSEADADAAREAGAEPTVVSRDRADLDELVAEVDDLAGDGVAGLRSFGVDVVNNDVLVKIDRSAGNDDTDRFVADVSEMEGVRVREVDGTFRQQQGGQTRPGTEWWDSGGKCSMGFSATDAGGGTHFVSAGHCMVSNPDDPAYGQSGQQNRIGTANVGGDHALNEREGDMGVVAVTEPGWELSAEVNTHGDADPFDITGSVDAMVGDAICQSGDTTGFKCGEVTAVDQTVDYGGGTIVEGLSFATPCTDFGDSGGAWIAGPNAAGVHSGGVGVDNCSDGEDNAAFQPVNEALQNWDLTLYTDGGGGEDTEPPTAPANLRVTGTTSTSVSLAWDASTDNVGVTGYDVYNDDALATTVTGTSATVTGLAPDTDYRFLVEARDAAGNTSPPSNKVAARTEPGDPGGDDEPPTTPGNPRATDVTSTTVSLEWDASVDNVGVEAYDVFNAGDLAATTEDTSATVGDLEPGTEYSFTVQARDAAGNKSKPTRPVTATTDDDAPGDDRTFTNDTEYPIRDYWVTISQIGSTAAGAATNPVTVTITASHTCTQDLQIGVVSPNGRYYQLQRYGFDNWVCTPFPSPQTFTFAPVDEPAAGRWTLRIGDNGPGDTGVLHSWSITV